MFRHWDRQLSDCKLFDGVPPQELNIMLECLNPLVRGYTKNECVVMAGERYTGVGVLLEGQVIVIKDNAAGQRTVIASLQEGDLFGEMVAFSGKKIWPATVIAQQDCRVLFLAPDKIVGNCQRQCPSHRRLIRNMLEIVSDRAILLNKKVEYLTIKSLRGKIAAFLLEEYKKVKATTFLLPFNRNELADFLNVARPSLSREMGKMKAEGIIDFHGASVKIMDLETLKEMVE